MFAVMGITGNVGGKIADTLLQHGRQVRGIVRDQAKAQAWKQKGVELVTADYDENLINAFRGVDGVFAMIPPNLLPDPGFPDSVARIAAIKKAILVARPPRAVFLSSVGSEKTSGLGLITATHILEQELSRTEASSAFLRAGSFMENIIHSIPATRATGNYFALYQPLNKSFPLIASEDIGRIGGSRLGKVTGSWNSLGRLTAHPPMLPPLLAKRSTVLLPPSPFRAKPGWRPWHSMGCHPTAPVLTSKCSTALTPAGLTSACLTPNASKATWIWRPRSKRSLHRLSRDSSPKRVVPPANVQIQLCQP